MDGIPDGFRMNDAACCKCQTPPSCLTLFGDEITNIFTGFITSPVEPIIYQIIFMAITGIVVIFGIKNGIEKREVPHNSLGGFTT